MTCAPSEDSDQPGHPPSLIRVFAVRMKKHWALTYLLSAQWRLWSDWADAQADLSPSWAHMPFCFFFHAAAHIIYHQDLRRRGRRRIINIMCHLLASVVHLSWANEPHRDKTSKMACAPSEDSDQAGHPPSLIRVFAVRMKKPCVFSYPLSAQRRLWSDWTDVQADLSFRWAHSHFAGFVMRRLKFSAAIARRLSRRTIFFAATTKILS